MAFDRWHHYTNVVDNLVPLHALVLVLLRDHASSVAEAYRRFPAHEVLTPQSVASDLVGQPERPDLMAICLIEMQRRVALKLSLGERVVVAAPALARAAQRAAFTRLAVLQGATVVYWLGEGSEGDLSHGDGVAEVMLATPAPQVVLPLPAAALVSLSRRFRGLTILGDVHGDLAGLRGALAWARMRHHFVWFPRRCHRLRRANAGGADRGLSHGHAGRGRVHPGQS
jgi:hypothetical protein